MVSTIDLLRWQTMTATVNLMKSPNQFWHRMLFGDQRTLSTETIELWYLHKGREMAPFVRKGAEGIMVKGHTAKAYTVEAPNIRIKMPFTPSDLFFQRRPGSAIHPSGGEQLSAIEEHIAIDLQGMRDMITNSQEYLAAQAVTGTISYSVADEEVFTITAPRTAANNITLSGANLWSASTSKPETDVRNVKALVSEEVGLTVDTAVMGSEAATAFRENVAIRALLDRQNGIRVGPGLDFAQNFTDDGAIFIGTIFGIDWWEYPRTMDVNGTPVDLTRKKFVEFFSRSKAARRVEYFGAIPDMKALSGRQLRSKLFAKSWEEHDPSAIMALLHSRPLPVIHLYDSHVSMQVVA